MTKIEPLGPLVAEDERNDRIHDLLETIREQIRLEVAPEHRPERLMTNIQNAVYAMRGRTRLMDDVALTIPLSAAPDLLDVAKSFLNIARHCEIASGVCGCGEAMDGHSHPMSAGHSPTDMADQVVWQAIQDAEAAIAKAEGRAAEPSPHLIDAVRKEG